MKLRSPNQKTLSASTSRRGYVLFAVLLVTVVLSLTAYRFSDSMVTENKVASRTADQVQARLAAVSGVYYAAGILADPNTMNNTLGLDPSDNSTLFAGQTFGSSGRAYFSLINLSPSLDANATGVARYPMRYGIIDESAKININAIMVQDPTGNALNAILMLLPNMTQQAADSICDYLDADSTARPQGAENDYYAGMQTPYQAKNGPLNSIDELLLVQGVTPQLLYGNDRNRNGVLDAGEDDGNDFNRGWSEFLTCYGRDINVDSTGAPRINLNNTDLATLSTQLTAAVGADLANYIIYYRISGSGRAFTPTLPPNQVAAPVSQLQDLVQTAIASGTMPKQQISSVLTVVNTQLALPTPPATVTITPGRGATVTQSPTPIIACPINDPATLKTVLPILLDKCTCSSNYELTPTININTAAPEVLAALPGLTSDDVTAITSARSGQNLTDPNVYTGAWLMTSANLSVDKFKAILPYIGGRSWTYRVHSVGYLGQPGAGAASPSSSGSTNQTSPVARIEAVIDVGTRTTDGNFTGLPRIIYYHDLTDLGRGFTNLPGAQ